MNWIDAIAQLTRRNTGFVIVTVLSVKGSSPRAEQTKMVVTGETVYHSIGGGNLEFEAIQTARSLLQGDRAAIERHDYSLGADLVQCCGGSVELLYECFPACDFNVVLCGAGHVGKALVSILSGLPCRVQWMDSRNELLESAVQEVGPSSSVTPVNFHNPYQSIDRCPSWSWYLVMTHSHEIDFELCEAILGRKKVQYCGLIGSKSKAASFRSRLNRKGFSATEIGLLTSPIGLDLGAGKRPMEVAVSISAQLMQLYYADLKQKREVFNPLSVVSNNHVD